MTRTVEDDGRTVIAMVTAYHSAIDDGDRTPLAFAYDEYRQLSDDEKTAVFASAIGYLHGATQSVARLLSLLPEPDGEIRPVDFDTVIQHLALGNV